MNKKSLLKLDVIEKFGLITIILSSVEVLDFSGGKITFSVTPFFVLSPIYMLLSVLKLPKISILKSNDLFFPIIVLFLFTFSIVTSIIFVENDPLSLSLQRALLTLWMILFSVYFICVNLKHLDMMIYYSAKAIIWLNFIFYALEFLLNRSLVGLPTFLEPYFSFSSILVNQIPRLYGIIADPNRSSTTTVFLMAVIYIFEINQKKSFPTFSLGVIIVGLSISRTSLISLLLFIFFVLIRQKILQSLGLFVVCLVTFSASIIYISQQDFGGEVYEAFVSSPDRQGSTDIHFSLLKEGVDLGFSDFRKFLIGTGWGTEYYYAAEFFDNDKYANFHSGYVSVFTQTGVFGLIFYFLIMILPAFRSREKLMFVAIILCSNIFYQYSAQFSYWFFVISAAFFKQSEKIHQFRHQIKTFRA